ncbi:MULTISPECIES: thioesterase family protein [unclassified Sphingomonas]|uniref:acyl-CoA thioesterase n=1 Tax=unclassified Sphingomonas TaxID=196159 RepID=UPI00285FD64A|nr:MULTISPECIES: thioesterase family protein [unclassified Sphingomonas]MDR6116529.1 acyl-CoA thioester hydrolase [Sphingomonas sp. SORGH_AS_0789]MDR6149796.1 acyl-CoA thioester hydrolase [Sphingomonas sp. SORGH_AS_0742]
MFDDGMTHSCAFAVTAPDIDHMGHVNNTVYLRWIQEAVISFWHRVAPADAVRSIAWVALKHEITYRCPAFVDERVDVITRAEYLVGAKGYFLATVRRGDTVLAEVRSVWCSVDSTSLRPIRLARELRDMIFVKPKPSL